MHNIYKILFVAILILNTAQNTKAQGCSDAGFCTLSTFKPISVETDEIENSFKVGLNSSFTRNKIIVLGNYFEYNRKIDKNFSINSKITTLAQTGNNVSKFGLADIFVSATSKTGANASLNIGAKLPLNNANRMENGKTLPMDYQSSLGTIDLILGYNFAIKNIQFAIAAQQPLIQNKNTFNPNAFPADSKLRNFKNTNQFMRKADVFFRASYPIYASERLTVTPSYTHIYHIKNDTYLNEQNVETEIIGSRGTTLNANVYLDYFLKNNNILQLNIIQPFLARKATPDGLQRSFILNLEYTIKF